MTSLVIRPCRATDLDALEWDGEFAHDRSIIDGAFAQMQSGTMVMLVAELAGFHIGQVWLDFARKPDRALLWALRVKPHCQHSGIGSRLVAAAERTSRARGAESIELEVEPGNSVRRFYERCGYRHVRYELTRDRGGRVVGITFLVLRKALAVPRRALTCAARLA